MLKSSSSVGKDFCFKAEKEARKSIKVAPIIIFLSFHRFVYCSKMCHLTFLFVSLPKLRLANDFDSDLLEKTNDLSCLPKKSRKLCIYSIFVNKLVNIHHRIDLKSNLKVKNSCGKSSGRKWNKLFL